MSHVTSRILSIIALAGALAVGTPIAASAAQLECGNLNRPIVVQGKNASTTSKSFVDVPGSEMNFSPQDTLCFMVEFSAKVSAPSPQILRVRLGLDTPGDHRAALDTVVPASMDFQTVTASDGKATTFIVRNPVGGVPRTIKLQFLSVKGGEVTLESWTAIVRYDSGV